MFIDIVHYSLSYSMAWMFNKSSWAELIQCSFSRHGFCTTGTIARRTPWLPRSNNATVRSEPCSRVWTNCRWYAMRENPHSLFANLFVFVVLLKCNDQCGGGFFEWSVILSFFNITQCFSMFHKMGFFNDSFPQFNTGKTTKITSVFLWPPVLNIAICVDIHKSMVSSKLQSSVCLEHYNMGRVFSNFGTFLGRRNIHTYVLFAEFLQSWYIGEFQIL